MCQSSSISLTANKPHTVRTVFDRGGEPNLIREDFLDAYWLTAVPANNLSSLRNVSNQKGSFVEKNNVTYPND